MKITEDVRKYAAEQGPSESEALEAGMEEKAKEFGRAVQRFPPRHRTRTGTITLVRSAPWYKNYEQLRTTVEALRQQFKRRCSDLGVDLTVVLADFTREIVSRAVHESNWQEGIEVDATLLRLVAIRDSRIALVGDL